VLICGSCGRDNPVDARFCNGCGAALATAEARREVRKTVTVLFCDVTGSTSLGESTDPEALRALLAGYFERMKGIVESHGGTVEKFIGDAVMAVFGVPAAHEDDAMRACRAAVEMRDALPELGIQGRIGINTGEVVTGTEERLATGDAVNVAARLEQAAEPGEVLIGEATNTIVREAVVAEPVEPLTLKGKSEPAPAYRLLAVLDAPERVHASRFVGRESELAQIVAAWDRARAHSSCELVTVVGEAGVGKSRLVAEALDGIEAPVVRARCLPYGEGITYWPVVEAVKQLDALPSDEAAASAVRSLLGESDRPTSADEIAWAFRKLLEEQAPLVVCFDDLQWGEETFLDLVESLGLLSAGAPMLLLCMARPELLERRPSWPMPLRLEPLAPEEADALIGRSLPDDLRRRIADRAGGNPLFITEMLALATEGGELEVPPTLRALLAARLDQLEPQERSVLERGAVEGEVFHRGAVQALAPEEPEVLPRLAALVRHELIRPERPQFPGDDGFRFRHLLIRDAAYDSLPKAVRADLHRRFADWLTDKTTLVELDELLGYHLEQSARYQTELGRPDPTVALRAGDRLMVAGVRALGRDDERAAAGLLERALSLTRPLRFDVHAELDLAQALWHEPARSARIAEDAAVRAHEAGDANGEALAGAMAAFFRSIISPSAQDELEALLLEARRRLEDAEDHVGLVYVWSALGYGVASARGRYDDWATASEQALHHSRLAGRSVPPPTSLGVSLAMGSRPADEALATVDRLREETASSWLLLVRAWLLAMLDRSDEAWQDAEEAHARLHDQGSARWVDSFLAELSTLAGDHADASKRLRIVCDWLEETDHHAQLATALPQLGRTLCVLGRFDEAEQLAKRGRAIDVNEDDAETQVYVCQVLARVHAHRGELAEAERLARQAVAEGERTDSLNLQAEALCDLGEVLAADGRPDDAAAAFEQALDRARRKKNLVLARQIRDRLVELRAEKAKRSSPLDGHVGHEQRRVGEAP
jgi:class 3 adenylate cyclase/tetratricopeptide (TPR) repeat protein